jgi:hypothetical protein
MTNVDAERLRRRRNLTAQPARPLKRNQHGHRSFSSYGRSKGGSKNCDDDDVDARFLAGGGCVGGRRRRRRRLLTLLPCSLDYKLFESMNRRRRQWRRRRELLKTCVWPPEATAAAAAAAVNRGSHAHLLHVAEAAATTSKAAATARGVSAAARGDLDVRETNQINNALARIRGETTDDILDNKKNCKKCKFFLIRSQK